MRSGTHSQENVILTKPTVNFSCMNLPMHVRFFVSGVSILAYNGSEVIKLFHVA